MKSALLETTPDNLGALRRPISFSLVDDDEDVRQALRLGLQSIPGFICIGSYASGAEALAGIPQLPGDAVLMDIRMPGMTGIECTQRLHTVLPKLPIVMLTGCGDHFSISQALMAGAAGYLIKPVRARECAQAVTEVLQGGVPLHRQAALSVLSAFRGAHASDPSDGLSLRERELMTCLFQRFSDKQIADQMRIAPGTVHTYLQRLFEKLNVNNRADAVGKYLSGQPG